MPNWPEVLSIYRLVNVIMNDVMILTVDDL